MCLLRNSRCPLFAAFFALAGVFLVSTLEARQQDSWEGDLKTSPPPGKQLFNSTCAGCHGLDGRGSEKAPGIANSAKSQRLSDAQVSTIISNGIAGTGMPGFHSLSLAQVRSVVSYLHVLQGKGDARVIPGDAGRGQQIFFGKGECSTCHVISGEGGFLGPDLSGFGSVKSAKTVREEILRRDRIVPLSYRSALVATRDGNRVEGIVKNEDNFSIQLQSKDGSFLFLQKSDLHMLEYSAQPLMPTNYGERLSHRELDDLVSYLMSPNSSPGKADATRGKDDTK